MIEVKLDSDVNFRITLINTLIKEINELSLCIKPIVTELEITNFVNDNTSEIIDKIKVNKNIYGSNHMEDVFYFVKEYCKRRYFDEILRYVNYDKKDTISNKITIDNYGKN